MMIYLKAGTFYAKNIYRNLKQGVKVCAALPWYFSDLLAFKKKLGRQKDFPLFSVYPCVLDKHAEGGIASGHYFHQDLWVAQDIAKSNPAKHVDIGSRIDGFVAHVASFREIEVLDVRPITSTIENVRFKQADLMTENTELDAYCDSLSCLHALEHFGLGRYGDTIDIDGHLKGFANMSRLLKKGGVFYFSTPIGKQRIEFNAHRVFDINYLLRLFGNQYEIARFCLVDDNGDFHKDVSLADEAAVAANFGCYWGCGIFKLVKKI